MERARDVVCPPWNNEPDGSLKEDGMEFTLAVWHTHAEEHLKALFRQFKGAKASSRCSVHIHTNVCDFTPDQIRSLILLYTIFERPLYRFSGNRWNSNYCVPVQTWAIGLRLPSLSLGDIAHVFPKYSGLNVFPDEGKLGTVEFRHMAGNKNPLLVQEWINILAELVKYAQTQDYQQLVNRINNMRFDSEYWTLFKEVFKKHHNALNYSTFDKDIETGITFAKLISQ